MQHEFSAESPDNYQQKCCCVLVLDVSSSMKGQPIAELNQGLADFHRDILTDSTTADRLEIALIEFSDQVKLLVAPSLAANFSMPTLTVKGTTKLVDGVREGIKVMHARKTWYKNTGQPYYRPWVILITDGEPDEGQDINGLSIEIAKGVREKDLFFFAIGVQGANMEMLTAISDRSMPAAKLQGLRFSDFFKWLSASMTTVINSKDGDKIDMPTPASWMTGFSV